MWNRYGDYLCSRGGDDFKNAVFAYIDKEDSPRPVTYQQHLLQRVGFDNVELLHKKFVLFGFWGDQEQLSSDKVASCNHNNGCVETNDPAHLQDLERWTDQIYDFLSKIRIVLKMQAGSNVKK